VSEKEHEPEEENNESSIALSEIIGVEPLEEFVPHGITRN
jgi:hypothetical protein